MATITFVPDSVTVEPNKSATVAWTSSATIFALIGSSNTNVATVSPSSAYASRGTLKITGVADGNATISFGSSHTGTLPVTVKTTLVTVKDSTLKGIANAIRSKNGESTTYLPSEMAGKINDMVIASGNWANVFSGTSSVITDTSITSLISYAFGVPGNTSNRGYLTAASLPEVTRIDDYAFYYQTELATVTFSSNLSYIGRYAFSNCSALEAIDCRKVTSLLSHAFYYCQALTEIKAPKSDSIPQDVCAYCSSLVKADFGSLSNTTIGSSAFYNCPALETLIIRKTDAVLTGRSNMFTSSCPIAQGTGYIYVPSALVDGYKTAKYWSTYASQIRAIEDYSSDGTVNGDINV